MSHDSMIEVIAAHRDGKDVEFQPITYSGSKYGLWSSLLANEFDFTGYRYRIKPEPPPKPREFWIAIYKAPDVDMHPASENPSNARAANPMAQEIVHVREVLPSTGEEGNQFATDTQPH